MAAASVAQVHRATLLNGARVVIKIQRPRARAQVTTDLDILERLAADAERRTEWARDYGASALAAEFARALREELDYRVEAANTEMLRGAIDRSQSPALNVPAVYNDLSTSRMLVLERAGGIPFSRLTPDALPPDAAHKVVDGVVDSVFEQIAVRGVFHADLHAGNLILAADGKVTLIDFGAIGILERSVRRLLAPLLVAIANDDDVSATDIVLLLCAPMAGGSVEQAVLQHDIGAILTRVANAQVGENVFSALIDVLRRHRLAMPPSLLLVFRTLISLEGALRRLVPDYDMVGRGLSRAPHIALQLASPRVVALGLQAQSAIVAEQLRRLPRRIEGITQSLQDGTFQVRVRALESADDRRWLDSILGEVTATIVGSRWWRRASSSPCPTSGRRSPRTCEPSRSWAACSASAECFCSCEASAGHSAGELPRAEVISRNPGPTPPGCNSVEGWSIIGISATAVSKSRRSPTATG